MAVDYTDLQGAIKRARDAGASEDDIYNILSRTGQQDAMNETQSLANEQPATPNPETPAMTTVNSSAGGYADMYESDMEIISNGIQQAPSAKSDSFVHQKALDIVMMKNAMEPGLDVKLAYSQALNEVQNTNDIDSLMNSYQRSLSNDSLGNAYEAIQREMEADPINNIPKYAEQLQTLSAVDNLYEGSEGRSAAIRNSYSKEDPFSRKYREDEVQLLVNDKLTKLFEDRGILDKTIDIAGIIFDPVSFTLDANEIAKSIDPNYKGGSADYLKKVVHAFHLMDPEEKKQHIDDLINQVWESTDHNQFKTSAIMGLFFDPDYASDIKLSETLDAIEAGTLLTSAPITGTYKLLKSGAKLLSPRSLLKNMKNGKAAVDITDPNLNTVQRAMDADPVGWEDTIVGLNANDGLAKEYADLYKEIEAGIVLPMQKAATEARLQKVEALTDAEKAAQISKELIDVSKKEGSVIHSARVVSQDKTGFKIEYAVDAERNGVHTPVVAEFKWSVDAAGSLVAENQTVKSNFYNNNAAGTFWGSADNVLSNLTDAVSKATEGGNVGARLTNNLSKVWKSTEAGLNRKSRVAVDELIIAGDEADTVFKAGDLLAGNVQTISGKRKYTKEEVMAYVKKRAFFDEMHAIENQMVRDKLVFQGYTKETSWANADGKVTKSISRPIRDLREMTTDPDENILLVGVDGMSQMVKRSQLDMTKLVAEGAAPVRLLSKHTDEAGNGARYAVFKRGESVLDDLPEQVLNKNPGYAPRIRKPGYTYIKDATTGRTLGFFAKRENAQKYADDFNAKNTDGTKLIAVPDRDMSTMEALVEDADSYGGLYTGARSKTPLFAGDDLDGQITRFSTGQSVQRMLESIGTVMPLNEYRIAMIQKWKETIRTVTKSQGIDTSSPFMRQLDDPSLWKTMDLNFIADPATRNSLEYLREYMFNVLRVPTKSENSWQSFMMAIADRVPNGKANGLVMSMAHTNPVGALKSATFDAYLGWFNLRQLYVQMQNSAIAISMHPVHAVTAVPEALIQRLGLFTKVDATDMANAAKGIVPDKQLPDIMESLAQFKASGLRDSVMRTGDYSANVAGFTSGTLESYQAAAKAGRIFFEEGESMSRLISWNIARKVWKEKNPGKAIDGDAIKEITADTLRMNMNMQKENAARFQNHTILGIPTQFLQVQTKFIENVVGGLLGNGKWTLKEASAVFAGQVVLYGTAGNMLSDEANVAFQEFIDKKQHGQDKGSRLNFEATNPQSAAMLNGGLAQLISYNLGFNNDFSESGSIWSGMDDNFIFDVIMAASDVIAGDTSDMKLSAPSIGVLQRTGDAVLDTANAAKMIVNVPTLESAGINLLKSLDSIVSITSTWSNARKVLLIERLGGIIDKKGHVLLGVEDFDKETFQSQLAKAMGIELNVLKSYYGQRLNNLDFEGNKKQATRELRQAFLEFSVHRNIEIYQAQTSAILSDFDGDEWLLVRQDIIQTALKDLVDSKTAKDREAATTMINYVRSGGNLDLAPGILNLAPKEDK